MGLDGVPLALLEDDLLPLEAMNQFELSRGQLPFALISEPA